MVTQPLNAPRLFVVTAFALACFGLMLYLWSAFGGAVPLKPKGYRVVIALPEADLLSTQADVRISGVTIGKVVSTSRKPSPTDPNRKDAILEIDHQYAPLRTDVKAMIRRKSLAGEEYLELTPGDASSPAIPDGGRIANARVAPSVEIDELLRTFDAPTRRNFEIWMQSQAASIQGRGAELNAAIGNLPAFEDGFQHLFRTLNRQQPAVQALIRNTGVVFDAISQRQAALEGFITNSERATAAIAGQSKAFADTWRAFPPFEKNSKALLERAESFRKNADPVLTQLRPGFREFGKTLQVTQPTAHELKGLMQGLGPLTQAGKQGLPASRKFFADFRPFLAEWPNFLDQFNPFLAYIGTDPAAITSLVANLTAVTQLTAPGEGNPAPIHVARAGMNLSPSALALYPDHPLPSNRANAYPAADDNFTATTPNKVLNASLCGALKWPTLPDAAVPGTGISDTLLARLHEFAFNNDQPVAPPCLQQTPAGGTTYPQVKALSHTSQSRGEG